MTGTFQIAQVRIAVASLHEEVQRLCAEYRVPEGKCDFAVETAQADIDFEREKSAREDRNAGRSVRLFSDAYLETLAVYRKIAERLPAYDTFLIHGSAISVEGVGYLFAAKSGTGKSTHARLWRELAGDRAVMLNDDKPLVRITSGGAEVWGTPWDGKHRLSANRSAPLRGIAFLEQAEENRIRPLSASESFPLLLQQTYRPVDSAAMAQTLRLLDALTARVPLWRLCCNLELSAARLAYETMSGEAGR